MSGERRGPGALVAVAGPSGAGKDTLLELARGALDGDRRFHFVRRAITRPSLPGAEAHDTLSEDAFAEALARGGFALHWEAHGLRYGLPASLDAAVAGERIAVANLSREAIGAARGRYRRVFAVLVTASPAVLARRLAARGRESETDILARLARAGEGSGEGWDKVIANDGAAEDAGAELTAFLREVAG